MARLPVHAAYAAAALSSLSAPRATMISASSGNWRCSALASSQGARIHTSRSSLVIKITGMAFGWTGSTTAFARWLGSRRRYAAPVSVLTWCPVAPELGPNAGERGQQSVFIHREPDHVLFLGLRVRLRRIFREAIEGHQASVLRLEPDRSRDRRSEAGGEGDSCSGTPTC